MLCKLVFSIHIAENTLKPTYFLVLSTTYRLNGILFNKSYFLTHTQRYTWGGRGGEGGILPLVYSCLTLVVL